MSADENLSSLLGDPNVVTSPSIRSTYLGKTRTFAGLGRVEWLFLIISFVNVVSCGALTVYRLVKVVSSEPNSPDFTFAIIVLVNSAFCGFYAIYGLLREKPFEIYAYCAAVLVILIYCCLEYGINSDSRTNVKLARLIMAVILGPLNVILGALVAYQFGWLEFRIVGASEELQYMYREAARFTSMLKFDLQLCVTFVILVLRHGTDTSWQTDLVLGLGIPLSFIIAFLGWIAMRKESKSLMLTFLLLGLIQPAYVIYDFYMVYSTHPMSAKKDESVMLWALIVLVTGAAALLLRFILYYEVYRVVCNFNKGLRERAFAIDERSSLLAVPRRR